MTPKQWFVRQALTGKLPLWMYTLIGKKIGKGVIQMAEEPVTPTNEVTKPGYKTTEFWLTIVSNAIMILGALDGKIDPKVAAIALAVLNGVYTALRGYVKK